MSCRAAPPAAGTFQIRVRDSMRSFSDSHWRTVKSTCVPSGETTGEPTAFTFEDVVDRDRLASARSAEAAQDDERNQRDERRASTWTSGRACTVHADRVRNSEVY